MARTAIRGWDSADDTIEGLGTKPASITYDSATTSRGFGSSLKIVGTNGVNNALAVVGSSPEWRRMNINFSAFPSSGSRPFYGASGSAHLDIDSTGAITYFAVAASQGTTAALSLNTWYCLEFLSSSSSTSQVRLKLTNLTTGVLVSSITTASTSTFFPQVGAGDTAAPTYTLYIDDYVTDNAAFPGVGYVFLMVPTSDNARAAKWTAGTSGTTNLFDAVNNLPPAGKVSPQTTTSAITHAGGGAGNEDYDANFSTYSSLGVGAADVIAGMQTVFVHAEDIATGTKTLTWGIKSNPTGSFETNVSAGGDVGAAGAYPTNWTVSRGAMIATPTVTISGSPIMSARRPLTESRLADVAFMGIYVDYTPTIVAFIARNPLVLGQSIRRASLY